MLDLLSRNESKWTASTTWTAIIIFFAHGNLVLFSFILQSLQTVLYNILIWTLQAANCKPGCCFLLLLLFHLFLLKTFSFVFSLFLIIISILASLIFSHSVLLFNTVLVLLLISKYYGILLLFLLNELLFLFRAGLFFNQIKKCLCTFIFLNVLNPVLLIFKILLDVLLLLFHI